MEPQCVGRTTSCTRGDWGTGCRTGRHASADYQGRQHTRIYHLYSNCCPWTNSTSVDIRIEIRRWHRWSLVSDTVIRASESSSTLLSYQWHEVALRVEYLRGLLLLGAHVETMVITTNTTSDCLVERVYHRDWVSVRINDDAWFLPMIITVSGSDNQDPYHAYINHLCMQISH